MRIAHVVRQYYPSWGGLEDFVQNLVAAQKIKGHDVSIVTLDTNFQTGEKLAAHEVIDDVVIHRVSYVGSQRYPIAPEVIRHLRDVDVVHVHAIDFFVDYLSLLKRVGAFDAKLIVSTHGGIFHTRSLQRIKQLFFNTVTPFSLARVDAVIASSFSDEKLFATISKNVMIIENGVRLQKFDAVAAQSNRRHLFYLGRFSENKNLPNLIRWFAAARQKHPDVRLLIAGRIDGGNYPEVMAAIEQLGLREAVDVVPNPSDAQIRDMIAQSGFVVSASTYEGFGLAVPELMSYGLVPLLSAIPSFQRFIEQSGIGASFALNEASFATALDNVLAYHSDEQVDVAERFAQRYSWDAVADRFDDIYRRVCATPERRMALARAIDQARIIDTESQRTMLVSNLLSQPANSLPPTSRAFVVDFLNQHAGNMLVKNGLFRADFLASDLILRDGTGARIAMKLFGRSEGLNMNGTDFIPLLICEFTRTHEMAPLFFFGTEEPWLSSGANTLARGHGGPVVLRNGFFGAEHYLADLLPYKNTFKLIVLAMGMPKQERIAMALKSADIGPALIVCGGAVIDFAAVRFARAPLWMQNAGLEWLFRLVNEPRRLFRRYVLGIPIFFANVFWSRLALNRVPLDTKQ